MANKEVYRLSIGVKVDGTDEAKAKLSAMEKMTQQMEKKMKALNKATVSPTAKINDNASSAINKIKSKATSLNNTRINPTAKITDNASNKIDSIFSKLKRLDATQAKATIRIKDEASSATEKIQKKTEKLKDSIPTVRIKAEDNASSTITKLENKISGWIKTGAKKIISIGVAGTIALGGIGVGSAINTFAKFEQGLSNVKAVTNATDAQMKQLSDTAKSLGASTAWSASAVTQAEELLGQAGFSVQETITALPGLLSLASAGSLDLAAATDIASGTLRAFGLSAKDSGHVADVLALSASATNSDVADLGDTMKYVAPVSASLGISLEDTAAAAGLLSNQSIKGSQAGTILRQTMARLASPTTEAAKVMKKYGINAFDAHDNMKPLSGVVDNLNSSLGKLTSKQRADVISTIFGTESMSGVMALMNQGGQSLGDLSQTLTETKGAADKMAETKLDNLLGQWEQLKGAAETMQINLGERLAPYAKQFVTWLTGKMPEIENKVMSIVDYLSKHTDDIKSLATTMIGLGAAFTALSAVGKIGNAVSGVKSLVSVFKGTQIAAETAEIAGGLSKVGVLGRLLPLIFNPAGLAVAASIALIGTAAVANSNLMKKSCTTTVEELGPVEKIMNKLNGNIIKSKSELIKAGLIYDDFGDGVSDSFKTAAQDASKSLLKIEMNLKKLTHNGGMDESNISQFKNYINDFAYESINAMKEHQSKIQAEFQKTFSIDGVTSGAEQKVLESLNTFFETGVNKQLEIRDGIYQFASDKIKKNGKLLDEDIDEIKKRLAEAKALELEYTKAQNAYDQAYAKNQFKNDASKITGIDGASELLQERVKEHQGSLDKIDNNYKGTLAYYESLLSNPNLSNEERTNFQNEYDQSKKNRDQAVQQENEGFESDKEVIYSNFEGARGKLNEKTGAKFSAKDIVRNDTLKTMTNNQFVGLTDVKESGRYSLINNDTGKYESVYAEVDKATGEIIAAYSYCGAEVGGYNEEMAESAKKTALEIGASNFQITSTLNTVKSASVNAAGEMIGDGDRLISKLGAVQTAQDGTLYRIMNINGTPINVQVDSSGAILNLDEVRQKAEEASKGRKVEIVSNTAEEIAKSKEYTTTMEAIPPNTDAHINSNVEEVTSSASGLLSSLESIGRQTWSAVVSITKKVFGDGGDSTQQEDYINSTTGVRHDTDGDGSPNYATGTTNAQRGWANTAEEGFEILIGKKKRWLNGGETILNHQQSKAFLQKQQQVNEPFQVKQGQYQLAQPQQVQVAGAGGNTVQVDIQVNGGNQDVETMIVEVTQEVGRKLKEALSNIKK